MGLTPEQVRFRLHRMKQKFRDLFERAATRRVNEESTVRNAVRIRTKRNLAEND